MTKNLASSISHDGEFKKFQIKDKMKKLKLLFITGSRGDWGYIRPILDICKTKDTIKPILCVTNMHALPSYGLSKEKIEKDGYKIDYLIHNSLDGYNHFTQTKSLGVFLTSLTDVVVNEHPDWIILAGDRGEQLIGAIIGAFCYIPIAHIQAGELSGNIDGMTRHAIGKFAHLHFASNKDAVERLIKLGEDSWRIHKVGAPQLDDLVHGRYSSKEYLEKTYKIDLSNKYILVIQHPVTEEYTLVSNQINITIEALKEFNNLKILIKPNNDAGSLALRSSIYKNEAEDFRIFSNLERKDFLGFMKYSTCMLGNSSSGIIEAPIFNIPVINLGRRQKGRVRGLNVIDIDFDKDKIISSLRQILNTLYKDTYESPYGDGNSSERIINILLNTPINNDLLTKDLTY
jgi:GDP/UDP-N,N'-diacetylbacillosamine 2-epimerase (hydrolysing)